MPKRLVQLEGKPLFDIASYARLGSSRRDRLSSKEIEQITLTVGRAPEVMVKVLTRGGQDLKSIRRHVSYINRGGELDIETDDGERVKGDGVESDLLLDWDLDLEEDRSRSKLGPREDRAPPKMVHKLLFSMPPGTPSQKVLEAVRNFAREEFALQHRYVMVLHTDEPHPHVHMLLKATSDHGKRLNIRKATLREWRQGFAQQLRSLGVAANATQRQVRGEPKPQKSDGIFRAGLRGESMHWLKRTDTVARQMAMGTFQVEPGKVRLVKTRKEVLRAWDAIFAALNKQGNRDLAEQVRLFAERMPPPLSEREWTAAQLAGQFRDSRVREGPAR